MRNDTRIGTPTTPDSNNRNARKLLGPAQFGGNVLVQLKNETSVHDFEQAIKREHGCLSAFNSRRVVHEVFPEQPVWEGEVLTFDLLNHPTHARCYVWAVDGQVTAVLHEGPVDSPRAAVRAVIGADKSGKP